MDLVGQVKQNVTHTINRLICLRAKMPRKSGGHFSTLKFETFESFFEFHLFAIHCYCFPVVCVCYCCSFALLFVLFISFVRATKLHF